MTLASSTSLPEEPRQQLLVHIRWLIRRDMPEVMAIEAASFEYAWTEEDFLNCLKQRECVGMVAEKGEQIVGFLVYQLREKSLRLLNFAVHPHFRRRDVGLQMVAKMVAKLSAHHRPWLTLRVRESNLAAQLFFRQAGFKASRVHRRYYKDSDEDAYEMRYCVT